MLVFGSIKYLKALFLVALVSTRTLVDDLQFLTHFYKTFSAKHGENGSYIFLQLLKNKPAHRNII